MYGQGLPNDQQMYNYVQMLSNTSKLSLSSSSSTEALNNVTGYSVPNQSQVSSLDRLKKDPSKVSVLFIVDACYLLSLKKYTQIVL
jgi:hypothetical protein